MNVALWIAQILLALAFGAAGVMTNPWLATATATATNVTNGTATIDLAA